MRVVDLPEHLAVIDTESTDLAIGPATDNYFIGEASAERRNSDTSV
jgi:hypothetical protein